MAVVELGRNLFSLDMLMPSEFTRVSAYVITSYLILLMKPILRFLRTRVSNNIYFLPNQVKHFPNLVFRQVSNIRLEKSWIGSTQTFLLQTVGLIAGPLFDSGYWSVYYLFNYFKCPIY